MKKLFLFAFLLFLLSQFTIGLTSCKKNDGQITPIDSSIVAPPAFDINSIKDTYEDVASIDKYLFWGPYNVHDPSIIKEGDYYYCYSTDVAFGAAVSPGIQIRKSKDLVQWQFVKWAFNGLPPQGAAYIKQNGAEPFNSLWAPYIIKVGTEFRLYYSLSSSVSKLSVIGLATATNPEGPWTEKGLAVTSRSDIAMTNAIDPSVIIDPQGQQWMYYGSAYDGIYVIKLDANTGLAQTAGDKGKRIAQRGFTGGVINGNIEGPEIIYNADLKKYFLFIAYDWLETKYNVRVGKGDKPDGPFYDFAGKDLNGNEDNGPMILAPYQFAGHSGWQGVSHPSVFSNNGQFYIAHQGRPGVNKFFMDLHVRKMYWTKTGWPVISPERYANLNNTLVTQNELAGDWEQIILGYRVVPGYSAEQTSPDFQVASTITLDAGGTINGQAGNKWTYTAPYLDLTWSNGFADQLIVDRERDWENKKNTIIFTGLNNVGTAIWGKRK